MKIDKKNETKAVWVTVLIALSFYAIQFFVTMYNKELLHWTVDTFWGMFVMLVTWIPFFITGRAISYAIYGDPKITFIEAFKKLSVKWFKILAYVALKSALIAVIVTMPLWLLVIACWRMQDCGWWQFVVIVLAGASTYLVFALLNVLMPK